MRLLRHREPRLHSRALAYCIVKGNLIDVLAALAAAKPRPRWTRSLFLTFVAETGAEETAMLMLPQEFDVREACTPPVTHTREQVDDAKMGWGLALAMGIIVALSWLLLPIVVCAKAAGLVGRGGDRDLFRTVGSKA